MKNQDNLLTPLNHTNPSSSKKFTAVYDGYFLLAGHEGYNLLSKNDSIIETYDWDQKQAVIEYIKKQNFKPLAIKPDSRIMKLSK
ncbi:MAG: hypothetical protein MZU97_01740 [Bacillus subtilis]|nr:hypothetical protein [Bacillus subtilis]